MNHKTLPLSTLATQRKPVPEEQCRSRNPYFQSAIVIKRRTAVFRPFGEVDGQGGYFRKGYFVLPKPLSTDVFFRFIAHELAHSWWREAPQQHAWLN